MLSVAVVSVGARIFMIGCQLLSVRLAVEYLGPDRFALWLAIIALSQFLGFSDLGIGASLLTLVPGAIGRDEWIGARMYVSAAVWKLAMISGGLLVVLACVQSYFPWGVLLGVRTEGIGIEAAGAAVALVGCFLVGMPLSVGNRVQCSLQDGGAALWTAASSALSLAGLAAGIHWQLSLVGLVWLSAGLPILSAAGNYAWVLWIQYPALRPEWRSEDRELGRELSATGLLFSAAQLGSAIGLGCDVIIVNHVLGTEAAVQHSLVTRLFTPVTMLLGLALTPLWPACAEAMGRGERAWARRIFAKSLLCGAVVLGSALLILVPVAPAVLRIWVPSQPTPSFGLLVAAAIHTVFFGFGTTVALFLNGTSRLHFQAATMCALAIVSLALKCSIGRLGLAEFIWAGALAQCLCVAVPVTVYLYRDHRTVSILPRPMAVQL